MKAGDNNMKKKMPPSKTWREAIPKTDYIFC